jgi:hypothetical protein
MATSAKSPISQLKLGSVSESVLAHHSSPILLVGRKVTASWNLGDAMLVAGVDSSQLAELMIPAVSAWTESFTATHPWLVQVLATVSTGPRPVLDAMVFAGTTPPGHGQERHRCRVRHCPWRPRPSTRRLRPHRQRVGTGDGLDGLGGEQITGGRPPATSYATHRYPSWSSQCSPRTDDEAIHPHLVSSSPSALN